MLLLNSFHAHSVYLEQGLTKNIRSIHLYLETCKVLQILRESLISRIDLRPLTHDDGLLENEEMALAHLWLLQGPLALVAHNVALLQQQALTRHIALGKVMTLR